jgi:O-antigen ligase
MRDDYPILGVGAGNFKVQMPYYVNSIKSWEMHNTFLSIIVETGYLGFISFFLFLTNIFFIGLRKSFSMKSEKFRNYLLMTVLGLVSSLIFQMVHSGLRNQHMWLGFALIVGINKYIDYSD